MIVAKTITEMRSTIKNLSHKKIAFVPTMGALHDGHLALIKKAKELADIVVVSIFVNKTQFNDQSDYINYPRQDLEDLKKLENCNVDLVFLPDEKEMFGDGLSFNIIPTKLTDCLCGSSRPGHFDGVALIVTKLFNIVEPDVALFGQKDFQQLAIIKKLVSDFNFDIEIFAHETCRQENGLAMSSRNQRLSDDNKIKASEIFKVMMEIKDEVKVPCDMNGILLEKSKKLLAIGFDKIDYLEIREEDGLELVVEFDSCKASRVFFAGYLGGVRLIDNLKVC